MDSKTLLEKLIADGADEAGIRDLFAGNDALYASCFGELLEEPNFALLEKALADGDCDAAFFAAHALKGVSGNLGLTALYGALCALVETLRAGTLAGAVEQYAAVALQREHLRQLAREEMRPGEAAAENSPSL